MIIRSVQLSDSPEWDAMRRALWPESPEDHAREIRAFFAGKLDDPQAVLVAQAGRSLVAFEELSIRHNLKELPGKRVGYVEGLYVIPAWRHRGLVRKLLSAARYWARQNYCEAFASDRADRIIVDPRF